MKKRIRLTEGDLHRIVRESVNRILEADFRQVDNLNDYIKQNKVTYNFYLWLKHKHQ